MKTLLQKLRTLLQNAWLLTARLRGRKVVIFHCHFGAHLTFMEPIWRRLVNRPDVRCWVVLHENYRAATVKYLRSRGLRAKDWLTITSPHSLKIVDVFLRPTGDTAPDCRCDCIQIFHGLAGWGCSKIGGVDATMDSLLPYNHLFLIGPNQEAIIRRDYFKFHPEAESRTTLHRIGYGKTDSLFDGSFAREKVLASLNLPADRPVVLFAPTWEEEAALHTAGDAILETLAALNVSFILKPHPLFLQRCWPRPDGRAWPAVLEEFCRTHPNCRLVMDPDANPYLVAADVLLTDMSGVGFEYILLDKPVVYWDCPAFFAKHGTAGIEYWGRTGGDIVTTAAELRTAVEQALANPGRHATERNRLAEQLVFNRGRAGEAAVQALDGILAKQRHS